MAAYLLLQPESLECFLKDKPKLNLFAVSLMEAP